MFACLYFLFMECKNKVKCPPLLWLIWDCAIEKRFSTKSMEIKCIAWSQHVDLYLSIFWIWTRGNNSSISIARVIHVATYLVFSIFFLIFFQRNRIPIQQPNMSNVNFDGMCMSLDGYVCLLQCFVIIHQWRFRNDLLIVSIIAGDISWVLIFMRIVNLNYWIDIFLFLS